MSCGIGRRCGWDPELLWLWCRPADTALIQPLAWEHPYAMEEAQEMAKRQTKKICIWDNNPSPLHLVSKVLSIAVV